MHCHTSHAADGWHVNGTNGMLMPRMQVNAMDGRLMPQMAKVHVCPKIAVAGHALKLQAIPADVPQLVRLYRGNQRRFNTIDIYCSYFTITSDVLYIQNWTGTQHALPKTYSLLQYKNPTPPMPLFKT